MDPISIWQSDFCDVVYFSLYVVYNCYVQQLEYIQSLFAGLHWILSPEPEEDVPPIASVEDLLASEAFFASPTPYVWLKTNMQITPDTTAKVADLTVGQRSNTLWCQIRKLRITASNFGPVLAAMRRGT